MADDNHEVQGAQKECVEAAIARNLSAHRSYYDQWLSSRRASLQSEVGDDASESFHNDAETLLQCL